MHLRALPLHPCTDSAPVLLEIQAPPGNARPRPDLDLALVLDRSGSMAGAPLEHARQAAAAAITSLGRRDRVALVVYDNNVDVLAPLSLPDQRMLTRLDQVEAGQTTALYPGWRTGAEELRQSGWQERLRRVLLLTDGQANVGLQDHDEIGMHVAGFARHGINTTTLGFGDHYNENLLRSMAACGAGNHYYVQSPAQLRDVFNQELAALEATVATDVRLEGNCEPSDELAPHPEGGWRLPDMQSEGLRRLLVTARPGHFRLSWTDPQTNERHQLNVHGWEDQAHPHVEEHLVIARAGQAQSRAGALLGEGRPTEAILTLQAAFEQLGTSKPALAFKGELLRQVEHIRTNRHSAAAKSIAASRHGGHGMYGIIEQRNRAKQRQLGKNVSWTPVPFPHERALGMLLGSAVEDWDHSLLAQMTERCWYDPSEVSTDHPLRDLPAIILPAAGPFGLFPVDVELFTGGDLRAMAVAQQLHEILTTGAYTGPNHAEGHPILEGAVQGALHPSQSLGNELFTKAADVFSGI